MTEPGSGALPPRLLAAIDRAIAVQRPAVLLHIRRIRNRNPHASPADALRILERRYLTAVTTGGAAVGATAMVPAVGTGTALALSGAETVGFLEATALFAQSVTELHGIALEDPERARALVLALMVGGPSQDLLKQFAGQATGAGPTRSRFWGELITKNLPRTVVAQMADQIRRVYLPRLIVTQTGSVVGRIIPFGIGAVVGGVGNQLLGRTIVRAARAAFGPPPATWPAELAIVARAPRPTRKQKKALASGAPPTQSPRRRAITRGPKAVPPPQESDTRSPKTVPPTADPKARGPKAVPPRPDPDTRSPKVVPPPPDPGTRSPEAAPPPPDPDSRGSGPPPA